MCFIARAVYFIHGPPVFGILANITTLQVQLNCYKSYALLLEPSPASSHVARLPSLQPQQAPTSPRAHLARLVFKILIRALPLCKQIKMAPSRVPCAQARRAEMAQFFNPADPKDLAEAGMHDALFGGPCPVVGRIGETFLALGQHARALSYSDEHSHVNHQNTYQGRIWQKLQHGQALAAAGS